MGGLAVISRQRFSPRPMRKAVEAIQTRKITEMKKTDPTRAERAANFFLSFCFNNVLFSEVTILTVLLKLKNTGSFDKRAWKPGRLEAVLMALIHLQTNTETNQQK